MSNNGVLEQLRRYPELASITQADLNTVSWQLKQRIYLTLLADIPSGGEAVSKLVRLQNERGRFRASEKRAGATSVQTRAAEDAYRDQFLCDVAGELETLGAAKGVFSASKFAKDSATCVRSFSFLATRCTSSPRRSSVDTIGTSSTGLGRGEGRRISSARSSLANEPRKTTAVDVRHFDAAAIGDMSIASSERRPSLPSLPEPPPAFSASEIALRSENDSLKSQLQELQLVVDSLMQSPSPDSAKAPAHHVTLLMCQIAQLRRQVVLQNSTAEAQATFIVESARLVESLDASVPPRFVDQVTNLQQQVIKMERAAALSAHTVLHIGPAAATFSTAKLNGKGGRDGSRRLKPSQLAGRTLHTGPCIAADSSGRCHPLNTQALASLEAHLAKCIESATNMTKTASLAFPPTVVSRGKTSEPMVSAANAAAEARSDLRRLLWTVAALGMAVPCAPESPMVGTVVADNDDVRENAAMAEMDAHMQRLAAAVHTKGDGSEKLQVLLSRLRVERRALASAASLSRQDLQNLKYAVFAREAAIQQLSLGLERAWRSYQKQVLGGSSESVRAVIDAYVAVEASPHLAALKRGAGGPEVAVLLATLAEHRTMLQELADGGVAHSRRMNSELGELWLRLESATMQLDDETSDEQEEKGSLDDDFKWHRK